MVIDHSGVSAKVPSPRDVWKTESKYEPNFDELETTLTPAF